MTKQTKILLCFPNPIATIPGGLTYVGKRFKRNGFEVKIHINTFRDYLTMDEIFNDVIEPFAPDIVGLSYGTYNILEIYRLQRMCQNKGVFVIAGGNHPSIKAEEGLSNGADLVFRGEAELGIDDFCTWYNSGKDPEKRKDLRGVSYKDNGQFINNPKPPRIDDLDDLGDMDFSSIDLKKFTVADNSIKGLNVISCGRGCPFHCSFCSHGDWYTYKHRSADRIIEEMVNRNKDFGIETFWLSDETFTVDKNHIYDFCDKFQKANLPFKWMMGTRANTVDEKLLLTMKNSGLSQVTYGIESADDETLKRVRKGYTAQQAYDAVLMTGKLQIPTNINLMAGFPWETPKHIKNNVDFIKAVDKYVTCFQLYGAVIPYPDTPIYEEYHEKENFTDFWLKEKFQNAGMVIYQNVPNPYEVSTYFQRYLYDDTYIADDYFFKFSKEYKHAVAKMGFLIGWKAIQAQTSSKIRQYYKYSLGVGSRLLYEINPNIEKKIMGSIMKENRIHDSRLTCKFIKK